LTTNTTAGVGVVTAQFSVPYSSGTFSGHGGSYQDDTSAGLVFVGAGSVMQFTNASVFGSLTLADIGSESFYGMFNYFADTQ